MTNRPSRKFRWTSAVSLVMLLLASFALPVQAGSRSPEKTGAAAPVPIPVHQPSEATAPGALPAPTLASPPDGAHTTGNPDDTTPGRILYRPLGVPCFQWHSVTDATRYHLQVSEVPQDTAIVLDIGLGLSKLEQTMYCPTGYDFATGSHGIQIYDETKITYCWRVQAYGGDPTAWVDFYG